MPADYLKDLIAKAKKTSGEEGSGSGFSLPKTAEPAIPAAKPGEETLGKEELEGKISAVRETLKQGLGEPQPAPKMKPALKLPPKRALAPKPAPKLAPEQALKQAPKPRLAIETNEPDEKIEFDLDTPEAAPAEKAGAGVPKPVPSGADFGIPAAPDATVFGISPAGAGGTGIPSGIPLTDEQGIPEEGPTKVSKVEETIAKVREKILLDSYGEVKIYKVPGEKQLYYVVPVPRPTGSEKRIIRTIKEAATRLITISPFRIRDPEQRRAVYRQRIMEILESAPEIQIPRGRREFYTEAVIREMVGYGLIDQLIKDDKLEEIMVTGSKKPVYIFHRDYDMMKTNIEFFSNEEVIDLINRIGREVGRRVDFSSPLLDARLADGSRVNATINPASVSGPTLTIRKFKEDPLSIIDLVNFGTMTTEVAAFLWLAVEGIETRPANVLIAGGTGSGKTTTLNVLASFIPETERVITIEDTAELNLPLEHWIRFESRPPGLESKGEITLDILTKNSLRMRPDRIIVGEIRHDEAFSLFTAMNTGHDGSIGTVHANSAQETIVRVTNPPMNVPETMLSGLNFIIVEHRLHDRKKGTIRRITEISEVTGVLEGKAQVQAIYEWDPVKDALKRTGVPSSYIRALASLAGMNNQQVQRELKKRQAFIESLVKQNIRSINETSERMKAFLLAESEK